MHRLNILVVMMPSVVMMCYFDEWYDDDDGLRFYQECSFLLWRRLDLLLWMLI